MGLEIKLASTQITFGCIWTFAGAVCVALESFKWLCLILMFSACRSCYSGGGRAGLVLEVGFVSPSPCVRGAVDSGFFSRDGTAWSSSLRESLARSSLLWSFPLQG